MPEKRTREQAAASKRRGNKVSTQAGAYVAEEIRHEKSGKHPIKNDKQAIAIGLSKAREAGLRIPKKKGK